MAWVAGFWLHKSAQRYRFLRTVEPRFASSVARIGLSAVRALRLVAWLLAVWPQAFEHASQEWLAARQASRPVGVGSGCEPFESLFAVLRCQQGYYQRTLSAPRVNWPDRIAGGHGGRGCNE